MDKKELEKRILSTNDAGLIAILYEALIKNFKTSIKAIQDGDYSLLNERTNHCRAIFTELMVQFSRGDEISESITEINLYLNRLITKGEYKRDPSFYEKSIGIVQPILEGFKELELKLEPKTLAGLTYGKGLLDEHLIQEGRIFEG